MKIKNAGLRTGLMEVHQTETLTVSKPYSSIFSET